jgi:hypothetical protein
MGHQRAAKTPMAMLIVPMIEMAIGIIGKERQLLRERIIGNSIK